MSKEQGGQPEAETVVANTEKPKTETHVEESEGTEGPVVENEGEKPEGEVKEQPFPAKAVKALNRQKSKNAKLRAEVRFLRDEIRRRETAQPSQDLKPPREEDFNSYGDLLEAKTDYKLKTELQKVQNNSEVEKLKSRQHQVISERLNGIAEIAENVKQQIPDYAQVMTTADLSDWPDEVSELAYELDNPALAIYALAKEGRLQDVGGMSPHIAAAHLLRAEERGEQYMQQAQKPKQTQAPDPMRGAKGVVSVRDDSNLSGKELLKKYKLR